MSKKALEDGREVYITMEQNVVPTQRYDEQTIRDAIRVVERRVSDLVSLSMLPTLFSFRSLEYRSVMKKLRSMCSGAVCLVLRQGVIQEALKLDQPMDLALASLGYSKYVVYPTPFQRDASPSVASPDFNYGLLRVARDVVLQPATYTYIEYVNQYDVYLLPIILVALVILSARLKA